jgi:hypothetical protein
MVALVKFLPTLTSSLLIGSLGLSAQAQGLIPAPEAGAIMGHYFCLEMTGQLSETESNQQLEQDLLERYGETATVASMARLAILDDSMALALEDSYAFDVLRTMMTVAIDDDDCFKAVFFGL